VFSALFVSPGFVDLMPPKKTRNEPSGMRSRSGWDMDAQPPSATDAEPTLPPALTGA
jgi:hypothetical protein